MSQNNSQIETVELGTFNSVQLNLVSFVDIAKADRNNCIEGCVYMMDNNKNSYNQGTDSLQTVCKQGQVLNWIIYGLDSEKQPNGKWPPSVRINNIVFLSPDGKDVEDIKVCAELKIFGGPDKIRSPYTSVYYYWAGMVISDLPPGVYRYRLVLEIDSVDSSNTTQKKYYNLDTPSLKVVEM